MISANVNPVRGAVLTENDAELDDSNKHIAGGQAPDVAPNLQESLQKLGGNDLTRDFLRLIPLNTEARRAFDSVVQLDRDEKLDQHHAQYLEVTGSGSLNRTSKYITNNSDETTDEASSD